MSKLSPRIHQAISRRLNLLYDAIIAEGVPDLLAAILAASASDPALPADSAAA
jgi:hypothetical protein